jgi:transcriptional regulator with XRE-family HTH domain
MDAPVSELTSGEGGILIVMARKNLGLSQHDLARLLFLTQSSVSHLENDNISIATLRNALDRLGYDLRLTAVRR